MKNTKIKIEVDLQMSVKETMAAVANALKIRETAELVESFPAGQHFLMDRKEGSIIITKL